MNRMRSKYLLTDLDDGAEQLPIGLRYDGRKMQVVLGGSKRLVGTMVSILTDVFGVPSKVVEDGQRVRVSGEDVTPRVWMRMLRVLRETWALEKVRSFRRLMG